MNRTAATQSNSIARLKSLFATSTDNGKKRFAITTLLFFVCFGYWSLATPMFAVPDEPAHLVRAYGISTGDFSGTPQAEGEPIYSVPKILTTEVCFARNPDQTANCLSFPSSKEEVLTTSSAASYPPLSHVLFSGPFFFSEGLGSLYIARLLGALVCALLFAFGLDSLTRIKQSMALPIGVSLGLTPMVMLSCASVNPTGMAISAAFATWSGGLAISKSEQTFISNKMVASLMIPLTIFLAIRRDSMLWGVAIMACLLVLIRWSTILHLLKKPLVLFFITVLCIEFLLQLFVWGGPGGQGLSESGPILSGSQTGNTLAAFGSLPNYFNEAIGVLGWLDTRMPDFVYLMWGSIFIGLFLLSASVAHVRLRLSMLIAFCVFVALPVKVGSVTFPYFQGRYALPLLIGVPLLATFSLKASADSILGNLRSVRTVSILIWALGVVGFFQAMRRYAVGLGSSWTELAHPKWGPPIFSTQILLITYPLVFLALILWVLRMLSGNRLSNP
jgi:uncharacterized membrane protein